VFSRLQMIERAHRLKLTYIYIYSTVLFIMVFHICVQQMLPTKFNSCTIAWWKLACRHWSSIWIHLFLIKNQLLRASCI